MSTLVLHSPGLPVAPGFRYNPSQPSHEIAKMNQFELQNDIILRESAYIADKLLKRLTPAQPPSYQTEVVPVRQAARPDAPTAQILTPKSPQMIQKPPAPQLSSRMHFNSLPIPQLQDSGRYLGKRKAADYEPTPAVELPPLPPPPPNNNTTEQPPPPVNQHISRAQTWPLNPVETSSKSGDLYKINEEEASNPLPEQITQLSLPNPLAQHPFAGKQPGPFPYFPSQRLPPPVPTKHTNTSLQFYNQFNNNQHVASSQYYHRFTSQREQRTNRTRFATPNIDSREQPAESQGNGIKNNTIIIPTRGKSTATGKRRPGHGVTITVPIIGPPPPGRKWRRDRDRKGKGGGASSTLNGGRSRSTSRSPVSASDSPSDNHGAQGWEEVEVRGVTRAFTT